jgi:hypothetical protein
MRWSEGELKGFQNAAQSLKLYRRADIHDDTADVDLIEDLYVDPLPSEHVFQTMIKPNTTFLIGRKGTGKSTVFQRTQHELRRMPAYISAYLDTKTIFESSQPDPTLLSRIEGHSSALPKSMIEKLLLYKAFLYALIKEIQEELRNKVKVSFWQKVKRLFSGSLEDLFADLDDLLSESQRADFTSVLGIKIENLRISDQEESTESLTLSGGLDFSVLPGANIAINHTDSDTMRLSEEKEFSDILMRVFNMKEYIVRIRALLSTISVKHLYIFLDDFSELPEEAQRIVVETILAPLNNWSTELIKFKVAAYPNRIYYGSIDKTKIDEINLDFYSLYKASDLTVMEEKAIEFTKRLIDRRLQYFCHTDFSAFCEAKSEDYHRLIYYATLANPRIIGYILFFLYETYLIYDKPISATALREAARRYYEEKIESYFTLNKFLHESFSERSSIYSLRELMEALINQARRVRKNNRSSILRDLPGRPPTSHFYILSSLEPLLSTLELNFFITKYHEMTDKDGKKITVFALNYGLCQKFFIEFGKPIGKREYRNYYRERLFDYTPILEQYMRNNQEIACTVCQSRFEPEQLSALRLYGMKCPKCNNGVCQSCVQNLL